MAACADRELLLGGLIDGELDAANTALIEAHVARCEGCREQLERLQAVRSLLRTDGVRHSAPETLTQRIANVRCSVGKRQCAQARGLKVQLAGLQGWQPVGL